VTCNADSEATDVSYGPPRTGAAAGPGDSAAPMMAPTLAELMRRTLKSRVATMSVKARSAIGLAGHEGDAVTWFGDRAWETSSAYAAAPVGWLVNYLKGNPVERDADKVWERSLPADRYQYSDEAPGERPGGGWAATFPHALGAAGDARFYAHWLQSPFADEALGRLAEAAVDAMHLGSEDRTDFLGVSFSMTDAIGHAFGPRSHEVQDTLVRLDAAIGRLLDHLDKRVGADNYVVAFSSDHGVADLPEQVEGGGRQPTAAARAAIEGAAKSALGEDGPFVAALSGNDVYFRPGVYDRLKAKPGAIRAIAESLVALPGIARVFTAEEIAAPAARSSRDPQIRAAALTYYPGRSGDLVIAVERNWMFSATGTTHGSLHPYDQRVPVLLYGAGIAAGVRNDAATPADLAATIASIVGVTLPSPDGRVLTGALKKR
jgi:predicted AlkP superfamily pyrophosphatase or phosphodiesterase